MNLHLKPNVEKMVTGLVELLGVGTLDQVVEQVQKETHANLVRKTPRRWTGNTRKAWQFGRRAPGISVIENESKAMRFLESGTPGNTRGMGWIKPKRAKWLFIPLRQEASNLEFNRSAARWGDVAGWKGLTEKGAEINYRTDKGNMASKRIIYGVDYILKKRVRGIKPRRIAEKEQTWTNNRVVGLLQQVLKRRGLRG